MNPVLNESISREAVRLRGADMRRAAAWLLLVLAVPAAAFSWIDEWLCAGPALRWLSFAIALGTLLWALVGLMRAVRTPEEKTVARLMDAHASAGSYAVTSALELGSDAAAAGDDLGLRRRLQDVASTRANGLSLPLVPVSRPVLVVGLLALVACGVHTAVFGTQALRRLWRPWLEQPYTVIQLKTPAVQPACREAFSLSGTVSGRRPAQVFVEATPGRIQRVAVAADGSFTLRLGDGIPARTRFIARGGVDGVSDPLDIDLRPTPQVANYDTRVIPPAYVRGGVRVEKLPSFTVLRGSTVDFGLLLDRKAGRIDWKPEGDNTPAVLEPDPSNPDRMRHRIDRIARTIGYELAVTDAYGSYSLEESAQQIVVVPDHPPTVDLLEQNSAKIKEPTDTFSMKFKARDDIGLARVRVFYEVAGRAPVEIPVVIASGTTAHEGAWSIALPETGAKPLDMLVIRVEAEDGNTLDGPGRGSSEPIFIEVPQPSGEEEQQEQSGKQGQSGPQPKQVNPLELQKGVYQDTLRALIGRGKATHEELRRRQDSALHHLQEMRGTPRAQRLGAEYLACIDQAIAAEKAAASAFARTTPRIKIRSNHMSEEDVREMFSPQLTPEQSMRAAQPVQGKAIDALIEAARIETAARRQKEQGEQEQQEQQAQDGEPETQYSLIRQSSPPQSEEEAREEAERAVKELEEELAAQDAHNERLLEERERAYRERDERMRRERQQQKDPARSKNKGKGRKESGEPSKGQEGEGGESSEEKSDSTGSGRLGQNQRSLAEQTREILARMSEMRRAANGADPEHALRELRAALAFQDNAAKALQAGETSFASFQGSAASEALARSIERAKALLSARTSGGVDVQQAPAGFEELIQDYSRRMSYDQ